MTVAIVRQVVTSDDAPHSTIVVTWCPGCSMQHPFRIASPGDPSLPVWTWDGDLERPTFGPSLLVHGSYHRCADEHLVQCAGADCGHLGHRVLGDGTLWVAGPHTTEPAWGDCHSFLRAGVWDFLGDCAHHLAGQQVPMVDLPEWLVE